MMEGMQGMGKDKYEDGEAPDFSKGETVLSAKQHPELRSVQQGDKISGQWEGVVKSIDGSDFTIEYKSMQLTTKNKADMEFERMGGMKEKKVSNQPVQMEDESEDY